MLSSSVLAAGVVIGVVPQGFVTGYSGNVTIEASKAAIVHFEDTTPADIVGGAGAPAHPVKSAFQIDMIAPARSRMVRMGRPSWRSRLDLRSRMVMGMSKYSDEDRARILEAAREAIEAAQAALDAPRPEIGRRSRTGFAKWRRQAREQDERFARERAESQPL